MKAPNIKKFLKLDSTPKKIVVFIIAFDLILFLVYIIKERKNSDSFSQTKVHHQYEGNTEKEKYEKVTQKKINNLQESLKELSVNVHEILPQERRDFYSASNRELIEIKRKKIKAALIYLNFRKETKVSPLFPRGYELTRVKEDYDAVEVVTAHHMQRDVAISTMVSKVRLDSDDMDTASLTLLGTSADEFEPVKKHGLTHPQLKNIQVYEFDDDENPMYVVKARLKGKEEVYITVSGKGKDIKSELPNIKLSFQKMNFFNK